ncbi:hypothetical protein J4475_00415 [Candidatus Woesearchaeota archaeon]|nr:hypothetical protein [Candidatus Woesearchaeota archaeon]
MSIIINQDIILAEDARLIKRLYKVRKETSFPDGLKFAYQYLVFRNNEWIEVCRIDNYKHDKNEIGTHIHKHGRKKVVFKELSFEEAEEYTMRLGEELRRL